MTSTTEIIKTRNRIGSLVKPAEEKKEKERDKKEVLEKKK